MVKIHPHFRLNQKSFRDLIELLTYLSNNFPNELEFIKELFNENNFIKVQTSGSTGKPKSISIPKISLLESAEATGKYFGLKAKTKALHCLSSQFIAGKMMWVRAIHLGWDLTLVQPDSKPLKNIVSHFDFSAMVPLQAQNSIHELPKIKKLIIGGAPLNHEWEEKLSKIPIEIFITYGMTETITHIAARKIGEKEYYCLPNISISVDKRNCLVIDLPYMKNKKIVTNDLVSILSEKSFEWLGRYDNIINSGGIKLVPEIIEKKLQPYILYDFFITNIVDEKLGEKLVLIVESDKKICNIESIFSKANLSKYEIPKDVFYISSFVKTKNEKINRTDTISNFNKLFL